VLEIAIVSLSVGLQVAAGVRALGLIRVTRHRLPWGLIALGLGGMAIRRAISLIGALTVGDTPTILPLPFEILGLATSCLMLGGVSLIRPVFEEAQKARNDAEQAAKEKATLAQELQTALDNIRVLSGILPTCASCKSIRDECGHWQRMEEYLRNRTEAEFSHGICPECMKRLYPEYGKPAPKKGG
jgi:hypothetical protein